MGKITILTATTFYEVYGPRYTFNIPNSPLIFEAIDSSSSLGFDDAGKPYIQVEVQFKGYFEMIAVEFVSGGNITQGEMMF